MSASVELVVSDADTAIALGSGTVPVLATPRVVALVEAAACRAVEAGLEPGQTTVGTRIELDHLRPTPVGGHVTAHAELTAVDRARLTFNVHATDGDGQVVARGIHTRAIVDAARFLSAP